MKLKFETYWGDIDKVTIIFIARILNSSTNLKCWRQAQRNSSIHYKIVDLKANIKKNLTDLYRAYKEGEDCSKNMEQKLKRI